VTDRLDAIEDAFPQRTRPLLVTGLVAGDPFVEATGDYMHAVVDGGTDAIELLVPFSDPIYHGSVMRRANQRAMSEHVGWQDVARLVEEFREDDARTPVIVSSYFNRVIACGQQHCVDALASAGVDALNIVDLPTEEAGEFREVLNGGNLALIQTVAPTTQPRRFRRLAKSARGLLLWTGHSGAQEDVDFDVFQQRVATFRRLTSLPVVASMNVESGDEAIDVVGSAHGVVVGSSLAWLIEGRGPDVAERLRDFVAELRDNIDTVEV